MSTDARIRRRFYGTGSRPMFGLMKLVLTVLVAISMAATLGVLFAGMLGVVRGGHTDPRRSNRLMRWRVMLQGLTLLLFVLLLSLLKR